MLRHPWRELAPITRVQDAVAFFHADDARRAALREALKNVYDLERLSTRISLNQGAPRGFIALRNSLAALPDVYAALQGAERLPGRILIQLPLLRVRCPRALPMWSSRGTTCKTARPCCKALWWTAPAVITEGGLFKTGYNAELDRLLDLAEHGEQKLQNMLAEEQEKTGISKLKLGFNRVFGYYYELTRAAHSGPAPFHFIRRQSLANAERFTTVELKDLEEELLSAADKRKTLEYSLFQDLRTHGRPAQTHHPRGGYGCQLDYWQSLAQVGRTNNWCRPELTRRPIWTSARAAPCG